MIQNVSYSRIKTYEACPRRAKFAYVDFVPEPPQEEDSPLLRGTQIHELCVEYILGHTEEPPVAKLSDSHKAILDQLRERAQEPDTHLALEQKWGFDEDWVPTDYYSDDCVIRVIPDVYDYDPDEGVAYVLDWKTGKKYRNEFKHGEQVRFYALAAVLRSDDIDRVEMDLVYLDVNERTEGHLDREDILRTLPSWTQRIATMREDRVFLPRPNVMHCAYCPYKEGKLGKSDRVGTGHCKAAP